MFCLSFNSVQAGLPYECFDVEVEIVGHRIDLVVFKNKQLPFRPVQEHKPHQAVVDDLLDHKDHNKLEYPFEKTEQELVTHEDTREHDQKDESGQHVDEYEVTPNGESLKQIREVRVRARSRMNLSIIYQLLSHRTGTS